MAAATGRNLVYYGKLLKDHPMVIETPMEMQPSSVKQRRQRVRDEHIHR
jgi:hypothetical protein